MQKKAVWTVFAFLGAGLLLIGCTRQKEPPLTVTWRGGVLSDHVLQVCNLSAAEGLEIYVYVRNSSNSVRSGNVVVPANSSREFGKLELQWDFKPGDEGFVSAVKYPRKLCFTLNADRTYRTWFALDDIPEIDVAAQVRERKEAELAEQISEKGIGLFVGIMQANMEREPIGLDSVWPSGDGGLKEQKLSDKLKGWKEKLSEKIGKKKVEEETTFFNEIKFKNSTDYFNMLFDVPNMGTDKWSPYVETNVTVVLSRDVGAGIKAGKILPESVLWSVLANHEDELYELSENVPVLITANFPCEKLCSFWDGKTNADAVIPLLNEQQLGMEMQYVFGVVYANGKIKCIPSGKATLREIYGNAFNTCTNGYNRTLRYLTPIGIVVASGFSDGAN